MPSDREAAREQRVEALAKVLRASGVEIGYVGGETYRQVLAERLLASDWLRDLLAEAKAEALREAADVLAKQPRVVDGSYRAADYCGEYATWLRERADHLRDRT